jgi:Phosphohydrolase-associated domain
MVFHGSGLRAEWAFVASKAGVSQARRARSVCDHIAQMTGRYAIAADLRPVPEISVSPEQVLRVITLRRGGSHASNAGALQIGGRAERRFLLPRTGN